MVWPYGEAEGKWKYRPIKGMLIWGTVLWKSSWNFEDWIKVEHADEESLPGLEDDLNWWVDIVVFSFDVATGVHEIRAH